MGMMDGLEGRLQKRRSQNGNINENVFKSLSVVNNVQSHRLAFDTIPSRLRDLAPLARVTLSSVTLALVSAARSALALIKSSELKR